MGRQPTLEDKKPMATACVSEVIQQLRKTALGDGSGRTDGELLEAFAGRRDAGALAALVQRHGAMVWGVCQRVLRCHHDVEDAFQATFLVFVRKAATIRHKEMVGNWLYGVRIRPRSGPGRWRLDEASGKGRCADAGARRGWRGNLE
ncbi:MAG: sigma factor [Gemmataceae bacterium]